MAPFSPSNFRSSVSALASDRTPRLEKRPRPCAPRAFISFRYFSFFCVAKARQWDEYSRAGRLLEPTQPTNP